MSAPPTIAAETGFLCELLAIDEGAFGALVAQRAKLRSFADRAPIYLEGEDSGCLYFVPSNIEGAAVEMLAGGGATRPVRIERIVGGDIFGEMEFLGRDASGRHPRRITSAYAIADVALIEVPYALFDRFTPEDLRPVLDAFGARTTARLQTYFGLIGQARFSDKQVLLAAWLVETAEDLGVREASGYRIYRKFNQADIGAAVGLSREAVSLHFSEWERSGLLQLERKGIRINDIERLKRIMSSAGERTLASHGASLRDIDVCLERGDNFRARNLGLEALRYYPRSVEVQHRTVLAVARMGAHEEAHDLMQRFGFADAVDGEALRQSLLVGIVAPESRKRETQPGASLEDEIADVAVDTQAVSLAASKRLPALLEDVLSLKGRILKDRAFEAAGSPDWSARCRAAAAAYKAAYQATGRLYSAINLAVLARLLGNDAEARDIAGRILARNAAAETFWDRATRGEAYLVLERWAEAQEAYATAAEAGDATEGKTASARLQLRRIADCMGSEVAAIRSALPQAQVACTGPSENAAPPGPTQDLAQLLRRNDIRHLYTDLVGDFELALAEAALQARCALHLVLPVAAPEFEEMQADRSGDAAGRRTRFYRLLGKARTLVIVSKSPTRRRDLAAYADLASDVRSGQSLLHADELESQALVLSRSGAAAVRIGQEAAGRTVRHVPMATLQCADAARIVRQATQGAAQADGAVEIKIFEASASVTVAVPDGMQQALRLFAAIAEDLARQDRPFQMLCDCDVVLQPDGTLDAGLASAAVSRWQDFRLPQNQIIATASFAAVARLSGLARDAIARVGRITEGDGAVSRPLPSRVFHLLRPSLF